MSFNIIAFLNMCVKTLKDTHFETEGVYEIARYQISDE